MRSLLSFLLVALAIPAHALLIRTDRDDAEYLELATKYTSFVPLGGTPGAGGVLVNPRWVLTSASVGKVLSEQKGRVLRIGGRDLGIERVFIHPEWKGANENAVALVLLREGARGIEATPVYRGTDEAGKTVVVVGSGYTGRIGANATAEKWDRKPRASVNTVDRVAPLTVGLKLKPHDDASDLQGAMAPGDAGGPIFIETDDGIRVLGIALGTEDANANGILGDIGDWENCARVSAFGDWVEKTMLDVAREEAAKLLGG
jgi:hypothetical protein